jgi:hypothetical protein
MKTAKKIPNGTTLNFPLDGKTFTVKRELWKVSDLKLDPKNQRLCYKLMIHKKGAPATEEKLHDMLWEIAPVKDLYHRIFNNGGLIEDPIIYSNGIVVEGNCRIVCLRELCKKYPQDERFKQVYVRVLPTNVNDIQLMLLLGELHIAGKIEWRAFDQAEYVWRMNKVHNKSYEFLTNHLHWSRSKLSQKISAYEETKIYIEQTGDQEGINRFSHFEEFMKKKELRDRVEDKKFMKEFRNWVFEGKFPDAKNIRLLPDIMKNKRAMEKFSKTGFKGAQQVLFESDPSLVSNLYGAVDQATVELENVSLMEISALKGGDEARLEKIRRLAKAIKKLEDFSGIRFDRKKT